MSSGFNTSRVGARLNIGHNSSSTLNLRFSLGQAVVPGRAPSALHPA
eukprot:CAMPEP_0205908592 /NCGR_PEP_ID=MMETSP1325-20131115/3318_1 /ASSEMBLY_ACC=CAM_ASM_000708 /TAXON_ID=236786 /ORGANISM="Florenciella sp., Strain RCC1007" /LENGTH=46 /DNA_ID= /DNA_START= /DNA_END= /DNA_ORIENTATION=